MTKNCMYSAQYSCGKIYKNKKSHPLKVRLQKHWKAECQGEIEKSSMVDHLWKEKRNHLPLWDVVKIIDNEEHWRNSGDFRLQ